MYQDVDEDKKCHENDGEEDVKKYRSLHFGVRHGREPLLPIEPMKVIGCCLHLLLSVVRTLWEHGVCVHLSGRGSKLRVEELNDKLTALGIHP